MAYEVCTLSVTIFAFVEKSVFKSSVSLVVVTGVVLLMCLPVIIYSIDLLKFHNFLIKNGMSTFDYLMF